MGYLGVKTLRSIRPLKVLAVDILEGNGTSDAPLTSVVYYIDTETGKILGQSAYWNGQRFIFAEELKEALLTKKEG